MPSFTNRLSLIRHTLADAFRTADYEYNWSRIDQFPGIFICTSASRPTDWGERQDGQMIFETDTNLIWHWAGDSWVRRLPAGLLEYQTQTVPANTASTSLQVVLTAIVEVPEGNRRVRISVGASTVFNTEGLTRFAIRRDGTTLADWRVQGKGIGTPPPEQPRALDKTIFDLPTAGETEYTLEFSATGAGGTSTIDADANNPIFIAVEDA